MSTRVSVNQPSLRQVTSSRRRRWRPWVAEDVAPGVAAWDFSIARGGGNRGEFHREARHHHSSTSGMGYAIATRLATSGASVVLNGRTDGGVTASVERMRREVRGADVTGIPTDLSDRRSIENLLAAEPYADVLIHVGAHGAQTILRHRRRLGTLLSRLREVCHSVVTPYAKGMVQGGWGRVLFNASVVGGFMPREMVHWGRARLPCSDCLGGWLRAWWPAVSR